MKTFKCTVTKETTMDITIDDSIWTEKEIKEWSEYFQEADSLKDIVERLAIMKSEYEDGEFMEGFGIPLIDNKKPYSDINDSDINKTLIVSNQEKFVDVDSEEK